MRKRPSFPAVKNNTLVEAGGSWTVGVTLRRGAKMKTVLVLEDQAIVMKVLLHILEPYNLLEAATAQEAIRLFIDHDHQIDCLVADVTVSTFSGIQVALLLRSKVQNLPVILTSGYPVNSWSDRDAADLERLGTSSVTILEKPFRAQTVLNAVGALIGTPPPAEKVRTA
jgi:CheY-like chemotaxis protein